jgi:hypothetical protein
MLSGGAEDWPPVPSHVHGSVAHVDEASGRALKLGTVSIQPLKDGDADERSGVGDTGGSTRIAKAA